MHSLLKKLSFIRKAYIYIKNVFRLYATKSFSQEGEDLLLKRIFEHKKNGFYIDVGAHHPFRFSNTYLFYKKGWKGINLDAMPNSMKIFEKHRPRDINLEIPVGKDGEKLVYYIFNEPALNTFDKNRIEAIVSKSVYTLIREMEIQIRSLKSILDEYLPKGQNIDFMSIDVEGLDFEVLKSNDWKKYRPEILLVESLGGGGGIDDFIKSGIYLFLQDQDYQLFAKTFNTFFLKNKR